MFRPMMRRKQQLPDEECRQILRQSLRGVLSVLGDDGYPYGLPINHFYNDEDGHLYFHSGKSGHKLDALSRCDKASFCVFDEGYRQPGEWALNIRSVIVFGRVRMVDDHQKALEISRRLSRKFIQDEAHIDREIARSGDRVQCFELIPEHISGKLVKEE
ncbi:MAG: pyridoxamine 5'-phosphate oxidase family protein [Acutalibacteraceae bacterium]|jgi:nitroimidazol reductase NimA-like FMN-containing flavoprotein (pyridoxamine 5'-phosphate oxidase superfamily)